MTASSTMKSLSAVLVFVPLILSAKISPYGGYLAIDQGANFYLECIGEQPEWILPTESLSNHTGTSTESIANNHKSILTIQSMDQTSQGPYLCQTNHSFSTIILQTTQRRTEMTKQIRFMNVNTNQTVPHGQDIRLNCFAQYYSEKAMDSPYLPRILWFFERKQLFTNNEKYILGPDSLVIRNFTTGDQGVYYCRAFITLKTQVLTKIYPILVQLQNSSAYPLDPRPLNETQNCNYSEAARVENHTLTYCNVHGSLTKRSCSTIEEEYLCAPSITLNQTLEILPNVSHLPVESGRVYTFLCRSNHPELIPEWIYENRSFISEKQITSYTLNRTTEVYLRLAPAFPGTYVCRARPAANQSITMERSLTLTTPMMMESNGISFQASTLSEYHLRVNATLFLACRPEYFDFQNRNTSLVPLASLIRVHDQKQFFLSDTTDGLLLDRIQSSDSGMYLCQAQIPFADRIAISYNPIMIFVSD